MNLISLTDDAYEVIKLYTKLHNYTTPSKLLTAIALSPTHITLHPTPPAKIPPAPNGATIHREMIQARQDNNLPPIPRHSAVVEPRKQRAFSLTKEAYSALQQMAYNYGLTRHPPVKGKRAASTGPTVGNVSLLVELIGEGVYTLTPLPSQLQQQPQPQQQPQEEQPQMPSSYHTLRSKAIQPYIQSLPAPNPNYRHLNLCTYTSAWRPLLQRARTLQYVLPTSATVKGFSTMLDDLADNNIQLNDTRPTWLKDPPYQDHFLGTGDFIRITMSPKPATILYLATWAFDHHILPKRNYDHLTAYAGIVIHLIGRGYITPERWPVNKRRHYPGDPDLNIDSQYRHNPQPKLPSTAAGY